MFPSATIPDAPNKAWLVMSAQCQQHVLCCMAATGLELEQSGSSHAADGMRRDILQHAAQNLKEMASKQSL